MKQKDAVKAYKALSRMKGATGQPAFQLFKLKKKLKDIFDFQGEEQLKLVEKYNCDISENGLVKIDDEETKKKFFEEWETIGDVDCEIEPVKIPISLLPNITLDEIEALDGFVIFE